MLDPRTDRRRIFRAAGRPFRETGTAARGEYALAPIALVTFGRKSDDRL
jgi:hypothetical protein